MNTEWTQGSFSSDHSFFSFSSDSKGWEKGGDGLEQDTEIVPPNGYNYKYENFLTFNQLCVGNRSMDVHLL